MTTAPTGRAAPWIVAVAATWIGALATPWIAAVALGGLLAACTPDRPAPGSAPEPSSEPAAAPVPPPAGPAASPAAPAASAAGAQPAASRQAIEFSSAQGYAIAVPPQVVMTAEEPCCDLAWARADDGFFMRIERLGGAVDPARLREDMELALSAVGAAEAVPPAELPDALRDAEPALRARSAEVTLVMLVAGIDGARFRVTLHAPRRDAAHAIVPLFRGMLETLRVTGPATAAGAGRADGAAR